QRGECVAKKCVDLEHAQDLKVELEKDIRRGQLDILAMKASRQRVASDEKPQAPTLAQFFDNTMAPFWEGSLSAGTYSRYESVFRLHIRPVLGDVALDELTRDQAKDLVVSLLKKNRTKRTETEEERKLSKDSIRAVVATLRAMLNEAMDRKLIPTN